MSANFTAKNLAELFYDTARKYGDKPGFGTRNKNKEFITTTFREVYDSGVALATGLIDLGLNAREHVAVLSENRLEWIVANYGILLSGAADVPRGTDVTDGDIRYIIPHSDAKIVFVENQTTLRKIQKNLSYLPKLTKIILMDANEVPNNETSLGENVLTMSDLLAKGKNLRFAGDRKVEERVSNIQGGDLFTIIYTSGTTGEPKGVMLTHSNMISQLRNIPIDIGPSDKFLSILPVWHSFERVFQMGTIVMGAVQYYTNIRNMREDLVIVKPTFMASAPRLWENIYQGIQSKIQTGSSAKRIIFKSAYYCALKIQRASHFFRGNRLELTQRNFVQSLWIGVQSIVSFILFIFPYLLLDSIVLKKIRQATGGKLRGTVSGGGALPLHIDEFFNAIGIPLFEGYGLTETAPGLAFRTPRQLVIGSVGPLFPETEIMLREIESGRVVYPPKKGVKGEIHVRGPQIMKGYYKRPEVTAKVLTDDGWFNTGDLGLITYNNTLKIVGRTKETVVLLNGENVEPVPIENRIAQSQFIDQVMVVGQDQKYLGVLVLPVLDKFKEYGTTYLELAANQKVREKIMLEVKDAISLENGFKSFEKIGEIRLLPKAFEVGDELSAKMSIKRHVITEKYQDLIDSMYQKKETPSEVSVLLRAK
ncbi:long-chain fatty acid--CoA ligase [Leptospira biflexa]|uniref:AMP-dependent synthetase/ligase n=1 Tax=Leptospira biflexa TaxID=172 RepID=UPI001090F4F2|nr:long-chain fatty acid--CoA ligase [Leptospira biflexa]TGM48086.1 long-chain fatty acid--CoA ligase [Leptospira biflexa]TGM49449.1 long-chain fatty acid--CoA ligase [Leptospira biflexa]